MSETKTYRLLSGNHGRFEGGKPVQYHKGDRVELTDAEAEYLDGRVALAGDPPAPAPAPGPEPKLVPAPLGLATLHWSKAAKLITELETAEAVQSAREEERTGKDRKGVLDAADARLAELEG